MTGLEGRAYMPTLVLMRHCKAQGFCGKGDFHRELTADGKDQARRAAAAVAAQVPQVDLIYTSAAARALATAQALADRYPQAELVADRDVYGADDYGILDVLNTFGRGQTMVVVGHEPTISSASAGLCDPESVVPSGVPTGTALVLEFDSDWQDLTWGDARLVGTILTPANG